MTQPSLHIQSPVKEARDMMYRDLLLNVGEACFAQTGYENTRMQDIALAAGISLKTLYNHFESKLALYRYIRDVRGEELLRASESNQTQLVTQVIENPFVGILAVMETPLRYFLAHPNYVKMQLHAGYSWFDPHAREGNEDLWHRGRAVLEQMHAAGSHTKIFVPMPIESFLMHLVAIQQTVLAIWVMDGLQADHEVLVMQAKAMFVRCFCTPSVSQQVLSSDGNQIIDPLPPWQDLLHQSENK